MTEKKERTTVEILTGANIHIVADDWRTYVDGGDQHFIVSQQNLVWPHLTIKDKDLLGLPMTEGDDLQLQVTEIADPEPALRPAKPKIVRPPAHFTSEVFRFIYNKKTFDRVFAPQIQDLRDEHAAALADKHVHLARWIAVRETARLLFMMKAHALVSIIKTFVQLWKIH